ncbi:MAG: 30S ribosomal protein S13 [Nanoarchaeota archaeon]|nr:30S ribosomal protein S13 [Nanoarchaeota archaeon]MBU0962871.1 30S ribosomal protein S13 [Nanoarchaeota archaeon]
MAEEKIKGIIRLMDKDIEGNTKLLKSLLMVYGVKFSMANAVCNYLNLDKGKKIGLFLPDELKTIEDLIKHPENKLPSWLFNRRKDPETGDDKHIASNDLKMRKEFDIKFMRKIKSYKGIRHSMGQPVRGQRTRAHFRKSGKSLGVTKKSVAGKKT